MRTVAARAGRRAPLSSEVAAEFWDATRHGALLLQWCSDCDRAVFFPRSFCPHCGGGDRLEWRPSAGRGVVHSFTADHKPPPDLGPDPWVVALIDLDEGVRIMSNIVGCPAAEVSVGMAVEVVWEPLEDGRHLPLFQPSTTDSSEE